MSESIISWGLITIAAWYGFAKFILAAISEYERRYEDGRDE